MPTYEESSAGDQIEAEGTGVNRRSVVKAGAAVAWSAPVISILAAAPAYASSTQAKLSSSVTTGTRNNSIVPFSGSVSNEPGIAATAVTLVLTLTATNNGGANAQNMSTSSATTPTGLDWGAPVKGGTGSTVTFTYVATLPLAGNSSIPFDSTVTVPANNRTGNWSAAVSTASGLGASTNGTF